MENRFRRRPYHCGANTSCVCGGMEFTGRYLSYFGVELITAKTTYTYVNTPRHYESVNIWKRHTHQSAPTAVAAPTEALRYLG
jgi:hypothetical protein